MCNFFSFVSLGDGKPIYFNSKERSKPIEGDSYDSHTTIACIKLKDNHADDRVNKYEYHNSMFIIDQINTNNDSKDMEKWINKFVKTKEFQKICLRMIKQNGWVIQFIDNPSEEMQLEAVKENGYALYYIKNPSEKVKLEAVKQNGYVIKYIDSPSEEMKLIAEKNTK